MPLLNSSTLFEMRVGWALLPVILSLGQECPSYVADVACYLFSTTRAANPRLSCDGDEDQQHPVPIRPTLHPKARGRRRQRQYWHLRLDEIGRQ